MADRNRVTVLLCAAGAALMLGGAFASKPLYDTFCRVTGFGGETRRADAAAETTLERRMTVRFDANIARGVPLTFEPLQREQDVQVGDNQLAFYTVTNRSKRAISVVASYNVTPHKAGPYFVKLECFCFQDMTLAAGESIELPVMYFIDPRIADDRGMDEVGAITLSYTFFESADGADGPLSGLAGADGSTG